MEAQKNYKLKKGEKYGVYRKNTGLEEEPIFESGNEKEMIRFWSDFRKGVDSLNYYLKTNMSAEYDYFYIDWEDEKIMNDQYFI